MEAQKKISESSWQYKQKYNGFIAGKVSTLTHELFIHVESAIIDYGDDKKRNYSHQKSVFDHYYFNNSYGKDVKMKNYNGIFKPIIVNINHTNLYLYEGWYVNKAVYKWLGTGYTDKEIFKNYHHGW
ncbi:MAG: hypothetical protein CVU04_00860 [Bacteroidetes bacterium HGW-Bacteroidetes-20]|nr:MAG: hypothetical protein CVU04_00860 [Bacteroidetes bacterium HGW-Bacteroidetes-20]